MLSWIAGAATLVVLLLYVRGAVGPRSGLSLPQALCFLLVSSFVAFVVAAFVAVLAVTATGLTLRSFSLQLVLSVVASEVCCIVFAGLVSGKGWPIPFGAAAGVLGPLAAAASWAEDALAHTQLDTDSLRGALAAFSWIAPLVFALLLFPRRAPQTDVASDL